MHRLYEKLPDDEDENDDEATLADKKPTKMMIARTQQTKRIIAIQQTHQQKTVLI